MRLRLLAAGALVSPCWAPLGRAGSGSGIRGLVVHDGEAGHVVFVSWKTLSRLTA